MEGVGDGVKVLFAVDLFLQKVVDGVDGAEAERLSLVVDVFHGVKLWAVSIFSYLIFAI